MAAAPTHHLVASFLRGSRWAPSTRGVATSILNRYTAWLDARGVKLTAATRDDAETWLAGQATGGGRDGTGLSPAAQRNNWQTLRALHRWLHAEGEADSDPMRRVPGPREVESPVVVITEAEYLAMAATCDRRRVLGRRDAAVLSLLWWSGLRRGEVVGLELGALDLDQATLVVGSATFTTKTRRVRRIPLATETVDLLERYLRSRGGDPGPLFLSQRDGRMTVSAVTEMLQRRAVAAGLGRRVGAHEFRRAMAVRYKRRGGSDGNLMAIAGWKSQTMVSRYVRMESEELAAEEFRRLIDDSAPTRRRRRAPRRAG